MKTNAAARPVSRPWVWMGLLLLLSSGARPAFALEGSLLLGTFGGVQSSEGHPDVFVSHRRLTASVDQQWSPAWSASVGLWSAYARAAGSQAAPAFDDGEADFLDAQWHHASSSGNSLLALRLQKAFVAFQRGPWQASAGRVTLSWGESCLARPTALFHAPRFLDVFGDAPVGSDGADASYALGPNTCVEGAARWLHGGEAEWLVRLENKGIGVSGTPLFARLRGREAMGLELSATLKHFQWRLEGTFLRPTGGGPWMPQYVTGLASVLKDFTYGVEFLHDGMGGALGDGGLRGSFVSLYGVTPDLYRLRFSPTLLKPLDGGGLCLKPALSLDLTKRTVCSLEGLWRAGNGPLSGVSTRIGLSLARSF